MMFSDCPVYRPTEEEFRNMENYVNNILVPSGAPKYGVAIIIPPTSWTPRKDTTYSDVQNSKIVTNPIVQSVEETGQSGFYSYNNLPWGTTQAGKKWCKSHRGSIELKNKNSINRINMTVKEFENFTQVDRSVTVGDREFWDMIREGKFNAIYGTDVAHTLMDENSGNCNLNNLCDTTLLRLVKNTMEVPGIRRSYLYFGSRHSAFAWHSENVDLFSANYLHLGADKVWYVIPASQSKEFESVIITEAKKLYPNCSVPSRHNPLIIDPVILRDKYKLKVTRVVQRKGMFVITFPYAYHCGYNVGTNIAEAANFSTKYWIPFGITAERCDCTNDVAFPIGVYIKLAKGEEFYTKWIGNGLTNKESIIEVPEVGEWVVAGQTNVDWTLHDAECGKTRNGRLQQILDDSKKQLRAKRKAERYRKKLRKEFNRMNDDSVLDGTATAAVAAMDDLPNKKKRRHKQLQLKKAIKKKEAALGMKL